MCDRYDVRTWLQVSKTAFEAAADQATVIIDLASPLLPQYVVDPVGSWKRMCQTGELFVIGLLSDDDGTAGTMSIRAVVDSADRRRFSGYLRTGRAYELRLRVDPDDPRIEVYSTVAGNTEEPLLIEFGWNAATQDEEAPRCSR